MHIYIYMRIYVFYIFISYLYKYEYIYIYIYIYIYVCVCVCVCVCLGKKGVEYDRMYVEKGKQNEIMLWFVYLPTHFDFNLFWIQKCFIEIILVWEIIMIDRFWFN